MTGRTAQVLRPLSPEGRARRWLPFWVVQATEIAIAVVFIDISIHVNHGGLLVAGALACLALAVTADGPLGLARVCGQPLHLTLAVAVAVLLAISPVIPSLRPDIEGIIVIEFGAIGLLRVCTLTRAGSSPGEARPPRWARPDGTVIDTTATVVDGGTRPASHHSSSTPSSSGAAARWAGRSTAVAASAGKQAAAKYGPAARARVKRTIRTAGRIAGTATSPPADPRDRAG
jgi:hypothetical protein